MEVRRALTRSQRSRCCAQASSTLVLRPPVIFSCSSLRQRRRSAQVDWAATLAWGCARGTHQPTTWCCDSGCSRSARRASMAARNATASSLRSTQHSVSEGLQHLPAPGGALRRGCACGCTAAPHRSCTSSKYASASAGPAAGTSAARAASAGGRRAAMPPDGARRREGRRQQKCTGLTGEAQRRWGRRRGSPSSAVCLRRRGAPCQPPIPPAAVLARTRPRFAAGAPSAAQWVTTRRVAKFAGQLARR